MTPAMKNHLTDQALDDVLIGLGSPAAHAHLAVCDECRARVESLQSTFTLFQQASRAFVEARPFHIAPDNTAVPRFRARPMLAVWIAAAVLVLLGGPAAWHLFSPHPVHAPTNVTGVQDTEAQIAEDNELLRQVDAAVSPDEKSVIDQYDLLEGQLQQAHPMMRTE